jgi:hypothetical protein
LSGFVVGLRGDFFKKNVGFPLVIKLCGAANKSTRELNLRDDVHDVLVCVHD